MTATANRYVQSAAAKRLKHIKTDSGHNEYLVDLLPLDFPTAVCDMVESSPVQRLAHFASLEPFLERIIKREKKVHLCLSAPPRHGKSSTIFFLIAQFLLKNPTCKVAYCVYAANVAEERNIDHILLACRQAGVDIDEKRMRRDVWKTKQGGGVWARGVGGSLTGLGFDLIIVDDPYKNRMEAESATAATIQAWFSSVAGTRITPGDLTSFIVTHTRWAPGDMIGQLSALPLYKYLNFPAINGKGEALWPAGFSIEALNDQRANGVSDYDFESLFQGNPQPRGKRLFEGVYYYKPEELPDDLRYCIGIDLAYTSKTYSDYSVAVVLARSKSTKKCYVIDVVRRQVAAPQFMEILKDIQRRNFNAPIFSYIGGTEKGVTDFFTKSGVKVEAEAAKADKHTRAQPSSAGWNAGNILLPSGYPDWCKDFCSELSTFNGVNDKHDDQVDALAGAYNKLTLPSQPRGMIQTRFMPF